ncbi:MAG TPA: hypothetical protein VHW70_10185 [Edaphobacter sp.]|nr:hypothetical protein [Edaphobacter sp.]
MLRTRPSARLIAPEDGIAVQPIQFTLLLASFSRFWQLTSQPVFYSSTIPIFGLSDLQCPTQPAPEEPRPPVTHEPISDPEPASPSLDEPDPGVFHHQPTKPPQ